MVGNDSYPFLCAPTASRGLGPESLSRGQPRYGLNTNAGREREREKKNKIMYRTNGPVQVVRKFIDIDLTFRFHPFNVVGGPFLVLEARTQQCWAFLMLKGAIRTVSSHRS